MPHPAHPFVNAGPFGLVLALLPFVAFLVVIAVFPLLPRISEWWGRHSSKLVLSIPAALAGAAVYLARTGDWATVGSTCLDYLAFIALLGCLFVVTGGIHISGSYAGLPPVNALFLALGAVSANLLGTTGASMLLIRPLLYANRVRKQRSHLVVFFILVVANCGGLLTPLGDPPLYLGFLHGVPFDWTLRLVPQWALTNGILVALFYWFDRRQFIREGHETRGAVGERVLGEQVIRSERALHLGGQRNLLWLMAIVALILASGYLIRPALGRALGAATAEVVAKLVQIVAMGGIAVLSYRTTHLHVHRANEFTLGPIQEVAALFFGIFGAMIPALAVLDQWGSRLGVTEPWQYFWATGGVSSWLDNAPTYLMFASLAAASTGVVPGELGELAARAPDLLAAVSTGAVFMGALTYVGNGPNFMLKAIAEHAGVKMPSFGRYVLWAGAILLPIFLLETWLFFR